MEREQERVKEKEPKLYSNLVETNMQWNFQVRRSIASLPRVVKFEATPWTQSVGSNQVKQFLRPEWKEPESGYPIRTMHVMEQVIPPGGNNGRHRHYNEAIFYVFEGRGHEIHDNVRYDWETGDVFTVPTYADHQHFNDDPQNPARLFFSANVNTYKSAAINIVDQLKPAPGFRLPPGAEGIYDEAGNVAGYRMAFCSRAFSPLPKPWRPRMEPNSVLCRRTCAWSTGLLGEHGFGALGLVQAMVGTRRTEAGERRHPTLQALDRLRCERATIGICCAASSGRHRGGASGRRRRHPPTGAAYSQYGAKTPDHAPTSRSNRSVTVKA